MLLLLNANDDNDDDNDENPVNDYINDFLLFYIKRIFNYVNLKCFIFFNYYIGIIWSSFNIFRVFFIMLFNDTFNPYNYSYSNDNYDMLI